MLKRGGGGIRFSKNNRFYENVFTNFLVKCLKAFDGFYLFLGNGDESGKSGKIKNTTIYTGFPHNPRILQSPFRHERDFTIVRMIVQAYAYYLTYRVIKGS